MDKTLLDAGVAGAILLAIGLFIDRRIWKWFVTDFWPQKRAQNERQATAIENMSAAVVGINVLLQSDRDERAHIRLTLDELKAEQQALLLKTEEILSRIEDLTP